MLEHKVARELCYDVFYLLSKSIEEFPIKGGDGSNVKLLASEIQRIKKVLSNLYSITLLHSKDEHEDGADYFSTEKWNTLYNAVSEEKFKAERRCMEVGRSFYTAYKTSMGAAIAAHIDDSIQAGYILIEKGDVTSEDIFEMNIYSAIKMLWEKRKYDYRTTFKRVSKIIYKEK